MWKKYYNSTVVLKRSKISQDFDINGDIGSTSTRSSINIGLRCRHKSDEAALNTSTSTKPRILATQALSCVDDGDSETSTEAARFHSQAERRVLRFWVVMIVAWFTRSLLHTVLPSVSFVRTTLAATDVALFYFVFWAKLHVTSGAEPLYSLFERTIRRIGVLRTRQPPVVTSLSCLAWIISMLGKYSGHRNTATSNNNDPEVSPWYLSVLSSITTPLGITSSIHPRSVWRFLLDSGLAIGLFMGFALMPRWLAALLTILTGVAFPCVRSAAALDMDDESKDNECESLSISSSLSSISSSREDEKPRNEHKEKVDAAMRRQGWLAYWPLYAFLVCALLGRWLRWLPLWPHVKMAAVVWLQADNFAGAFAVFDWVMARIGVLLASTIMQVPSKLCKRKLG